MLALASSLPEPPGLRHASKLATKSGSKLPQSKTLPVFNPPGCGRYDGFLIG
ncbi:hypothetical protein JIN84_16770 [Luteolibacter yonseiensis]|uniref:Uncharacterized protein n=1 Tax=Luteolibacter yonseiensis TaxID=1144680 RepID=A0A934R6S9_9BACT|nr:hypothetical protein [Luteolibacter yonseiensis]MBK1817276.1 hypothetical protein [Luteolibacter yonseiensis]